MGVTITVSSLFLRARCTFANTATNASTARIMIIARTAKGETVESSATPHYRNVIHTLQVNRGLFEA